MKRTNYYLLSLVFCAALATALYGFLSANAQTSSSQSSSTKLPTPSPKIAPTIVPSPTPEDDDEPITIDTEIVGLNVRVIDRNNRPINGLTQKDFQIYEDNVLQTIDSFTKAEVPTNYTLVVDNSGSLRLQLEKVIDAGKTIISTNKPEDETSIVRFVGSDNIDVKQEFTSNKPDLFDALDNLYIEGGQTAIIDAVYLAAQMTDEYEKTRNPSDKKRRALILVTDGEDRDSFYNEQQLFEILRETDVQIYVIGFVGDLSKEGGFISKSPQTKAKAFLERLAELTGGKAYFPNDVSELNTIATDIASELRTQYLVSYYPSNSSRDGTNRTIKVVVGDGPNRQKRIAITRTSRKAGK